MEKIFRTLLHSAASYDIEDKEEMRREDNQGLRVEIKDPVNQYPEIGKIFGQYREIEETSVQILEIVPEVVWIMVIEEIIEVLLKAPQEIVDLSTLGAHHRTLAVMQQAELRV